MGVLAPGWRGESAQPYGSELSFEAVGRGPIRPWSSVGRAKLGSHASIEWWAGDAPDSVIGVSRATIDELIQHCDLRRRQADVPPSAKIRGLYYNNNIKVLESAGKLEMFKALYPESHSSVRWYSCADYLERLAVAGAILTSPERVHEGMQLIGRNNAIAFADSLLGKTMIRLLSRDPTKLLKQGAAGRRQSCNYGRWELSFPEPRVSVMAMYDEYLWIESNLVGAAEGTLASIGIDAVSEVELDSAYQGRLTLRW